MEVNAILWDGFKKIHGELEIGDRDLRFHFLDFSDTDLQFDLSYTSIEQINIHSVFDLEQIGIEIISSKKKKNVFIVDNPRKIRKKILERLSKVK